MTTHRRTKCKTGKVKFIDKKMAEDFCVGKKLRAYKCDDCGSYHVTSELHEQKNIQLAYYHQFKKYLAK